jgi:uncharacterized damage-inducible protein DinB
MIDLDDLRYPIGPFIAPATSMAGMRVSQINTLRHLADHLRGAAQNLNDARLDTPYREGGWTVRQVIHHVADSHLNSYVRFKLALTEDWPTIKPYEEGAWAKLPDSSLPIEPSLVLIASLHERWVALLEAIDDADYRRGFHHPESGRMNLGTALAYYDWHSRHHTAHITNLRARQGW